MKEYKGFLIERKSNVVIVYNSNGQELKRVKTVKIAKGKIDNQTI